MGGKYAIVGRPGGWKVAGYSLFNASLVMRD
jgi:hypothetical protein